jgi:hypothetical protein
MWFNLVAAGGQDVGVKDQDMIATPIPPAQLTELGVKGRDIVAALMTSAQIAEAQKLAREWKPK